MQAITYSTARKELAKTMDRVCADHDTVIITRRNASPVVMLSLEDYESLTETNYLLRSNTNRERLTSAIDALQGGKGVTRELSE